MMHHLGRDFLFAWRRLRATPLFTAFAIATGISPAVRAVRTPPSGLAEIDRLVRITRRASGSGPMMWLSQPELQDLTSQQSSFDAITAWHWMRASVAGAGRAGQVSAGLVSGWYFETLGVVVVR